MSETKVQLERDLDIQRGVSQRMRAVFEQLKEENAQLRAELAKRPLRSFDQTAADLLADEVAALVRLKVIDSRSPAADALLDYRDPPATPRADRLAEMDHREAAVRAEGILEGLMMAAERIRNRSAELWAAPSSEVDHADEDEARDLDRLADEIDVMAREVKP